MSAAREPVAPLAAAEPLPIGASRRALRLFLRNPSALFGTVVLVFATLVALAAPLLYPEDPLSMVARPFLWPGARYSTPWPPAND